ncbi:MAG: 5'/3'-nucleotidase SurE [Gammaproteobacteria bacterium]|nr:MAG: 5'/3'-nucleotidase SurE [Gammaproteobacteria bacterium]
MRILISNDDGYDAKGIRILADTMSDMCSVTIVAPNRNRSGASNSLTLDRPIRVVQVDDHCYSVDGTPTDCVHLALTGLLSEEPDMVLSGINAGPNLGDDVLYSGTVAAATEGRFLGYPAIAVSIASFTPKHIETAARVTHEIVKGIMDQPLSSDIILNVNVPDIPYDALNGIRATRLGNRHKAEPVIRQMDPRGQPIYWIGEAGPEQDAGPGTDFHAVRHSHVSVTPIQVDRTRHHALDELNQWLEKLK